jgi:hypothetical protein
MLVLFWIKITLFGALYFAMINSHYKKMSLFGRHLTFSGKLDDYRFSPSPVGY